MRRIALGFGALDDRATQHVRRLKQLSLVEEQDDGLRLTELGLQRYAALDRPAKWDSETTPQEISRLLTKHTKPDGA